MNVYIHKPVNYSDMQGPCDSGFHIPLLSELNSLCSIFLDFGWITEGGNEYTVNSFNNIQQYLFAPADGYLWHGTGEYVSNTVIWWHSCNSDPNNGCYSLNINSTGLVLNNYTKYNNSKQIGKSIRPFKNTPVVPDSNWTVLYQGTGTAGIYHNSTLGLISLSSDGINWVTISDKNLGATTVYNYGDTLSEANCGKFYQRGNNYGFTRGINAGTTSSTAVDASSYGPGNYYSSSTFITAYPRDSSNNSNLRGGVTGAGGESELKNAYIGEYHREWNPDASRTLLYLPLESNGNDYSGNNRTTSATNISYGTLGGVATAYNSSGNGYISVTPTDIVVGSTEGTVSMLVYYTGGSSEYRIALNFNRYGSYGLGVGVYSGTYTIWGNASTPTLPSVTTNSWVHISYTVDSSGTTFYINGTKVGYGAKNTSSVRGNGSNDSNGNQYIFCSRGGNNNYWKGGIREVIIENKKWSDDDETNYYNFIKAKLGF